MPPYTRLLDFPTGSNPSPSDYIYSNINGVDKRLPISELSIVGANYVVPIGLAGDGVTDDGPAINTALALYGADTTLFIPAGTYKITTPIVVSNDRVRIVGAGRYATTFLFAPTANGACITFSKGASILFECGIEELTFFSNDSTYTKTAIDLKDTSNFYLNNVEVAGSIVAGGAQYWSGATSIGLRVRGRDIGSIRNLTIAADKPILISANPNSTISIDHFNFNNLYLIANANPCVEVETGVNITNVSFDGYQAWVKGTYGFYWNDTTSVAASTQLSFRNVRTEQGTNAAAYMFYIKHNSQLQGLSFENVYGGLDRNGFYLRNIIQGSFKNVEYISTTKIAMDAVGVASGFLDFRSCYFAGGSTATLTNYVAQLSMKQGTGSSPIPDTAHYVFASTDLTDYIRHGDVYFRTFKGSIANGAKLNLQCGTGAGVKNALISVVANDNAAHSIVGIAASNPLGHTLLSGSSEFDVGNVPPKLTVFNEGATTSLFNQTGVALDYLVTVHASK